MEGNKYQELAMRTNRKEFSQEENLINGCLGLAGEAGEVCDYVKKHIYQGHELDYNIVAEEASDCLWYIALVASTINMTIDDLMELNIKKLKRRYPDGFEIMRSINRTE